MVEYRGQANHYAQDAVNRIAEEAATKALRDTFRMLGVDLNDQESVNKFRADLVYARELRRFAESARAKFWLVIVGAGTVGFFTFAWKGFIALMTGSRG